MDRFRTDNKSFYGAALKDVLADLGFVIRWTNRKWWLRGGDLPGRGIAVVTVEDIIKELEMLGVDPASVAAL